MEKIEITNVDLTPNAIVLEGSEIITKTCEIYKFKISDEKKYDRLMSASCIDFDFDFDPDENDIDDFDFFLLRIKDNIISILEEGEVEIFYKDSDDGYYISSLFNLTEHIYDYLEESGGKLTMSRVGSRDNICIINDFDAYF